MNLRSYLLRLHWILASQIGIDLLRFCRSFVGLPRYVRDLRRFKSRYSGHLRCVPCLHDWNEGNGAICSEYFWQDLLVARMIFAANPIKHVDIGSRVDGFVSHVASFREIEVIDVRATTVKVDGVVFKQADLTQNAGVLAGYCDSLSSLHALEHFGLGRYGDAIDVDGCSLGLRNMAALLKDSGVFYLSVPVGAERVEFNANRVFDPRTIISEAALNGLHLMSLTTIRDGSKVEKINVDDAQLAVLARCSYTLAIFVFRKRVS